MNKKLLKNVIIFGLLHSICYNANSSETNSNISSSFSTQDSSTAAKEIFLSKSEEDIINKYEEYKQNPTKNFIPTLLQSCPNSNYLLAFLNVIYKNVVLQEAQSKLQNNAFAKQNTISLFDNFPITHWIKLTNSTGFQLTNAKNGQAFICEEINQNVTDYLNFFYCHGDGKLELSKISNTNYWNSKLRKGKSYKMMEQLFFGYFDSMYNKGENTEKLDKLLEIGRKIFGYKFISNFVSEIIRNSKELTLEIMHFSKFLDNQTFWDNVVFGERINNTVEQVNTSNTSKPNYINLKLFSINKKDMDGNHAIESSPKKFGNSSNFIVIPKENPNNKEVIDVYTPLILDKSQKNPSYCYLSSKEGMIQLAANCGVNIIEEVEKEAANFGINLNYYDLNYPCHSMGDIWQFFKTEILTKLNSKDYSEPKDLFTISKETLQALKPSLDIIEENNDSITTDLILAGSNIFQLTASKNNDNKYNISIKKANDEKIQKLYENFVKDVKSIDLSQYINNNTFYSIYWDLWQGNKINLNDFNKNGDLIDMLGIFLSKKSASNSNHIITFNNININGKFYNDIQLKIDCSYSRKYSKLVAQLPDDLCYDIASNIINNLFSNKGTDNDKANNTNTDQYKFVTKLASNLKNKNIKDPNVTNMLKYFVKNEKQLNNFIDYICNVYKRDNSILICFYYIIHGLNNLFGAHIKNNINSNENKVFINILEKFTDYFCTSNKENKRKIKQVHKMYKNFDEYISILKNRYGDNIKTDTNNPVHNIYEKLVKINEMYK